MAINVFGLGRRATVGLSVVAADALMGALLVAASSVPAAAAGCSTVGSQVTCTFSYNGTNGTDGAPQNFVVPTGVTSVTIEAWGGQGGGRSGTTGGHVRGTVTVTPTETLTVRVGGAPTLTTGGYNGGGNSLSSHGGGGASDVRRRGDALTNRIFVAGGGGGGASGIPLGGGGAGGGPNGGAGAYCRFPGCGGGTPTHGGQGGINVGCGPINGGDGRLGVGGDGGSGCGVVGGGGGGGLYGGGGGSANQVFMSGQFFTFASGGGGGSGFVTPTATDQRNEGDDVTGSGAVTITYTPGNIFETTFKRCNMLHVGYNRFINGTIVRWTVSTNGVGRVAEGQFTAIGGGKLGSKTYHFLNIPLGTTLPNEASGIQSHMHFYWGKGGRYVATRDSGC